MPTKTVEMGASRLFKISGSYNDVGMAKKIQPHEALLEQTISMVSEHGYEGISLRTIASRAGCSTATIFQHFQSKSGLIQAALEWAILQEEMFHDHLSNEIFSTINDHLSFSDFISTYIDLHVKTKYSRFFLEILFKSRKMEESKDYLLKWHNLRKDFWEYSLKKFPFSKNLSKIVSEYCIMEEVYAYALSDNHKYRLLLCETSRALTAASFNNGIASSKVGNVSKIINVPPHFSRPPDTSGNNVIREQLLLQAVDEIKENDIGALNQRDLSKKAGVSSSMIAYHFGNMKSFVNEALWRALVRGIPSEIDPDNREAKMPDTIEEWLTIINDYVTPRRGIEPSGFYTGFSIITGQACLLAKSQPALLPLIEYLRSLEGWGTYRVSRVIFPQAKLVSRDNAAAFGVWIKSEAVLREVGLTDENSGINSLKKAAAVIFPKSLN